MQAGSQIGVQTSPGLEGVSCSSATDCMAVGASFAGTLVERWDGSSWSSVNNPSPPNSAGANLAAVSCATATDCSAVGTVETQSGSGGIIDVVSAPLAEHWDGTSWSIVPVPSGASVGGLTGVACPSAISCAAVGGSASAIRWDGAHWSAALLSANFSESQLAQVSCPSPSSCFAVGVSDTATRGNTLVEHWNGTRWSVVPSPNPVGSFAAELTGVSCSSTTDCLAVGDYLSATSAAALVEHWNGTRWSIVASPQPSGVVAASLSGVSCSTPTSCLAVGSTETDTAQTALIERWDGTKATIVPSPTVRGAEFTELLGVSCRSASDCTATGASQGIVSGVSTLIERWDGAHWSVSASPNPLAKPFALLTGVSCSSSNNCNAVGIDASSATAPIKSFAEHWNGKNWVTFATADPTGATHTELRSVVCRSAISCYTVGVYSTASATKTLAEYWSGTNWSLSSSANPHGATAAALNGVACPSPFSCTAVGSYAANDSSYTLAEHGS